MKSFYCSLNPLCQKWHCYSFCTTYTSAREFGHWKRFKGLINLIKIISGPIPNIQSWMWFSVGLLIMLHYSLPCLGDYSETSVCRCRWIWCELHSRIKLRTRARGLPMVHGTRNSFRLATTVYQSQYWEKCLNERMER